MIEPGPSGLGLSGLAASGGDTAPHHPQSTANAHAQPQHEIPFNAAPPWVVLPSVMNFPRLVPSAAIEAKPLSGRSNDTLMTLAQAGSREAFAVLVERHALRVLRTCLRFTREKDKACELGQEIWVTVWERRARYQPGSEFLLWLVTIARNRCRNELRRERVVERYGNAGLHLGSEPTSAQIDSVLVEERRGRVHDALDRLPLAMREALLLRYGEELRYDEMSSVLGAAESTLRSRVHHGLKLLRRQLEKYL